MKTLLDVHTHTVASGHAFSTLQEMAAAASEKGLKLLGITRACPRHTGDVLPDLLPQPARGSPPDIRCRVIARGGIEHHRL